MSKLTTAARNKLKSSQFALSGRRYPLNTANRARNALSRSSEFATPSQDAAIKRKVKAKYPRIKVSA